MRKFDAKREKIKHSLNKDKFWTEIQATVLMLKHCNT